MSLRNCIRNLHAAREITLEERQALERRYDALLRQVMSRGEARERLIAELEAERDQKKRTALLSEGAREALHEHFDRFRDIFGRRNVAKALRAAVENFGDANGFLDVESRRKAILAGTHVELEELLHEFRKGAFSGDLRRTMNPEVAASLENVVRELFGEATNDPRAKQLADSWANVSDGLRQRFNAAGGAIGKLERWGLPQHHSQLAVAEAGFETWREHLLPLLDRERMRDGLTGARLTDDELERALGRMYERIATDGMIDVEPSGVRVGAGALFNRHADHRFLHFKDADAWLAYQRAFGEPSPFSAMMGHLATMARDIAAMETFGPNPAAMLEWAKQMARREAGLMAANIPELDKGLRPPTDPRERRRLANATEWNLNRVDQMWAHYSGSANAPVNGRVANGLAAAREWVSATALGSAAISAITDQAFGAITRRFNGIPVLPQVSGWVRAVGTAGQREAVRAGLILDSAVHVMHQQAAYAGSVSTRTIAGYVNDRVLTYSGLSAMTQASKHAFGMSYQANLADHVNTGYLSLPEPERRALARHGITSEVWDKMRAAPLYEPEPGAVFLRPQEIAATAGRDIAERYMIAILRETAFAVPEPTLRARSLVLGATRPGTLEGEALRSFVQFKSFGVVVLMMHGERMLRELNARGVAQGAAYAGGLLLATTLLGGVALQLKELVAGRDPRDMQPLEKLGAKFWGQAMLQGGGLGIYGDFLFADVNRFGGSLAGTIAGPLAGRADLVRGLTIGNAIEFAEGKERTNIGRESVRALKEMTPGSSLWYARLAWERVVLDQLQWLADRDAHQAFRRRLDQTRRERGNDYWWQPGETTPRRAPVPIGR